MSNLRSFYDEAMVALRALAEKHAVHLPEGHALVKEGTLHWRLSAHERDPEIYWEMMWEEHRAYLNIDTVVKPGDRAVDVNGQKWVLLGLDPGSDTHPVRVKGEQGEHFMISINTANTLISISE